MTKINKIFFKNNWQILSGICAAVILIATISYKIGAKITQLEATNKELSQKVDDLILLNNDFDQQLYADLKSVRQVVIEIGNHLNILSPETIEKIVIFNPENPRENWKFQFPKEYENKFDVNWDNAIELLNYEEREPIGASEGYKRLLESAKKYNLNE